MTQEEIKEYVDNIRQIRLIEKGEGNQPPITDKQYLNMTDKVAKLEKEIVEVKELLEDGRQGRKESIDDRWKDLEKYLALEKENAELKAQMKTWRGLFETFQVPMPEDMHSPEKPCYSSEAKSRLGTKNSIG